MGDEIRKLVTTSNLQYFKEKYDQKIADMKADYIYTCTAPTFDPMNNVPVFSTDIIHDILEKRPSVIRIGIMGYSDYMYASPAWTWDDNDSSHDHADYIEIDVDGSTTYIRYFMFRYNGSEYSCEGSCNEIDSSGGGSGEDSLSYASLNEIDALFGIQPVTPTYNITYGGQNVEYFASDGTGAAPETVSGGSQITIVARSTFDLGEVSASWNIYMGGENITSSTYIDNTNPNEVIITTPSVTGDIQIEVFFTRIESESWQVIYSGSFANYYGADGESDADQFITNGGHLVVVAKPDFQTPIGVSWNITMGGSVISTHEENNGIVSYADYTDRIVIEIPSVTGEVNISVSFEQEGMDQNTLSVTYSGNGSYSDTNSGNGAPEEVTSGDELDITIDPIESSPVDGIASSVIVSMGGDDISADSNLCSITQNGDSFRVIIYHVTDYVQIEVDYVHEEEPEPDQYDVNFSYDNATFSFMPSTINVGEPLSITVYSGGNPWIEKECYVVMGEDDITSQVVTEDGNNYIIYIPAVTDNVDIEAYYYIPEPEVDEWNIEYNFNNCYGSQEPATMEDGQSLYIAVHPLNDDGTRYTYNAAHISMDNAGDGNYIDITNTAWNSEHQEIYIHSVTGNVSIEVLYDDNDISVEGVSFSVGSISINEGNQCDISSYIVFTPNNASNKAYELTSDDDTIVSIVDNTIIEGTCAGDTTITVTTEDGGYTATMTVYVEPVEEENTWSVVYYLGNAEVNNGEIDEVNDGDPLNLRIAPTVGEWDSDYCYVYMGGSEITESCMSQDGSDYIISIQSVTGDVEIDCSYEIDEGPTEYSIMLNWDVRINNVNNWVDFPVEENESMTASVAENDIDLYSSYLRADSYTLNVFMGGEDVSTSGEGTVTYDDSNHIWNINIPIVTGDVDINLDIDSYHYSDNRTQTQYDSLLLLDYEVENGVVHRFAYGMDSYDDSYDDNHIEYPTVYVLRFFDGNLGQIDGGIVSLADIIANPSLYPGIYVGATPADTSRVLVFAVTGNETGVSSISDFAHIDICVDDGSHTISSGQAINLVSAFGDFNNTLANADLYVEPNTNDPSESNFSGQFELFGKIE